MFVSMKFRKFRTDDIFLKECQQEQKLLIFLEIIIKTKIMH